MKRLSFLTEWKCDNDCSIPLSVNKSPERERCVSKFIVRKACPTVIPAHCEENTDTFNEMEIVMKHDRRMSSTSCTRMFTSQLPLIEQAIF
jgi:hypothetical protein